MFSDRRGVSSLEYSVLFVLVGLACVAAWRSLGEQALCTIGLAQNQFVQALGGEVAQLAARRCAAGASVASRSEPRAGPGLGSLATNATGEPVALPGLFTGHIIEAPHARDPVPANEPGTTRYGMDVDNLLFQSANATNNWNAAAARGLFVQWGYAGSGSVTEFDAMGNAVITIDSNLRGQPALIAAVLSHELGHATNPLPPDNWTQTETKEAYVKRNVDAALLNEAIATLANVRARNEIFAASGSDIGLNGDQADAYAWIVVALDNGVITEPQALAAIAPIIGAKEKTSNTGEVYNTYYTDFYSKQYDTKLQAYLDSLAIPPGEQFPLL